MIRPTQTQTTRSAKTPNDETIEAIQQVKAGKTKAVTLDELTQQFALEAS